MPQWIVPNPDAAVHVGFRRAVPREATVAAIAGARPAGLTAGKARSPARPSVPIVARWATPAE